MATGILRPTEPADAAKIGASLAENIGARVHVDVSIPRTSIKGKMRLADRSESLSITTETRRAFKAAGLLDEEGRVVGIAADDWAAEIAVRYLAIAIRDPADISKQLAPIDEWRQCDDDQIEALWSEYRDLRQQIDPLSDDATSLSSEDLDMISLAVKKKESAVLMSYGSRKLASFLLTTAGPPAS